MSDYFLIDIASALSLADARKISDATLAAAREANLLPLTVAVLDSGGHAVNIQREDGCGNARITSWLPLLSHFSSLYGVARRGFCSRVWMDIRISRQFLTSPCGCVGTCSFVQHHCLISV